MVESKTRRKKSRGASAGFFQFAETVEAEEFWNDPDLTKDLKVRLNGQSRFDFTLDANSRLVYQTSPVA